MTQVMEEKSLYLGHFEEFEKNLGAGDRPWLRRSRKAAIARFDELGFPGPRHEDWKFTRLSVLAKLPFHLAEGESRSLSSPLKKLATEPGTGPRLVFVNGRFAKEFSSPGRLAKGVILSSLAEAIVKQENLVEPRLARNARYDEHALTALNTAFLQDGAFIFIPKGIVLEQPIHLVYLTGAAGERTISHPRNLLVTEPSSQVTIVEHHVGPENGVYFTNAVTEIIAGENSIIDHYKVQEESERAFHIANTQAVLARCCNFTSHYVSLGGGLVRNEVRVLFDAEGSEATINGLYLGSGRQHVDNLTVIDHAKPHCASHELYKGILADQAHGVFNGKIYVRQDAQKTDAKQTNQVLLLSEDAIINTKPQLEIFADDVKCTHGATVGQLDADALFYLRSRGIGLEEARSLLTYAFANDILGRIKIEAIRERLEKVLIARKFATQDFPSLQTSEV